MIYILLIIIIALLSIIVYRGRDKGAYARKIFSRISSEQQEQFRKEERQKILDIINRNKKDEDKLTLDDFNKEDDNEK